ncbi:hypothetical protein PIB30_037770 [Stylosanthes scabra]|uniref:Replication protein A 70 kDa DNA-binding subunit B/D first OB fold domain-containing protein n=1 Tax=Stylosanthes scabra TaxID=79078 RepID=A0ABU6WC77_9FABA|nr:hypothetical protein [Stylosanthes scabra]
MASSSAVAASSEETDRVADVRPAKLRCKLVVAVVQLYQLPNPWISKDAISMELVLQDQEGDRIHCSIGREHVGAYRSVIRENGIYSMKNFIIQRNIKPPRTTAHEFKLSVYGKTEVMTLASNTFQFSHFRLMPLPAQFYTHISVLHSH